jgi:hypothetical protein
MEQSDGLHYNNHNGNVNTIYPDIGGNKCSPSGLAESEQLFMNFILELAGSLRRT